ncbi:MAG: hypothetical protein ABI597_04085 [Gammaproteobacteria bacterium]
MIERKSESEITITKANLANLVKISVQGLTHVAIKINCVNLTVQDYILIGKFILSIPANIDLGLSNDKHQLKYISEEGLNSFFNIIKDKEKSIKAIHLGIFLVESPNIFHKVYKTLTNTIFLRDNASAERQFYANLIRMIFSLRELTSFTWSFIGDTVNLGMNCLGTILGENQTKLSKLSLVNVLITPGSFSTTVNLNAVFIGIAKNTHLKSLTLSAITLETVSDSLVSAIVNGKIESLLLSSREFSSHTTRTAWKDISAAIAKSPSLQEVTIDNMNNLSTSGNENQSCECPTCKLEKESKTRGEFIIDELSSNLIRFKSNIKVLACGMIESPKAYDCLANLLKLNCCLIKVDLIESSLGDDAIKILIKALQHNQSLKFLLLGNLKISERKVKGFITFLKNRRKSLIILNTEKTITILDTDGKVDETSELVARIQQAINETIPDINYVLDRIKEFVIKKIQSDVLSKIRKEVIRLLPDSSYYLARVRNLINEGGELVDCTTKLKQMITESIQLVDKGLNLYTDLIIKEFTINLFHSTLEEIDYLFMPSQIIYDGLANKIFNIIKDYFMQSYTGIVIEYRNILKIGFENTLAHHIKTLTPVSDLLAPPPVIAALDQEHKSEDSHTTETDSANQKQNPIAIKLRERQLERQQKKEARQKANLAHEREQKTKKEAWLRQKEEYRKQKEEKLKHALEKQAISTKPQLLHAEEAKPNGIQQSSVERKNYLSIALGYLIKVKYIVLDKTADDKWRSCNNKIPDPLLDTIRHYALLYNIFRLFEALKKYRSNKDSSTNFDDSKVFRNMLIHFGAANASHQAVWKTAHQLADAVNENSLPREFLKERKPHLMEHALPASDLSILAGLFGIGDELRFLLDRNYRPILEDNRDFLNLFESTSLYKELYKLHEEKVDNDGIQLDLLKNTVLKAALIFDSVQKVQGNDITIRPATISQFYENHYQQVDALKMLLAIIGHYYYLLDAQNIGRKSKSYFCETFTDKLGPQIQHFYNFLIYTHNKVRIPVSHHFPDCTYHDEIAESFKLFKKILNLNDVFFALEKVFYVSSTPIEAETTIVKHQASTISMTKSKNSSDESDKFGQAEFSKLQKELSMQFLAFSDAPYIDKDNVETEVKSVSLVNTSASNDVPVVNKSLTLNAKARNFTPTLFNLPSGTTLTPTLPPTTELQSSTMSKSP